MPIEMQAYMETRRKFLANRAAFPAEELEKYVGLWVAWSPDGTRVAASAADPELLDSLLQNSGEDPSQCIIEGIPGVDDEFGEADGSAA